MSERPEPTPPEYTNEIAAEHALDILKPEERKSVFSLYCQHCGDKQPKGRICVCWNDE